MSWFTGLKRVWSKKKLDFDMGLKVPKPDFVVSFF